MRTAALTALLAALAVTVVLAGTAHAATTRSVCAPTALLRDSPDGFVIGHLRRGQRLQLQRHSANRRWALVVTRAGTVGWLQVRRLCHA